MKNLQPVKFGALVASVVLLAGAANTHSADAERTMPKSVEVGSSAKSEITEIAEAAEKSKQSEPADYDLYHTIRDGENLWVLAELLTGDGSNWKALAEVNDLDESGAVKSGQTIHIPASFNKVALNTVTLLPDDKNLPTDKVSAVKAEMENISKSVTLPAASKPMVYLYEEEIKESK